MSFPRIILKPKKDQSPRRFHPWIFSGAVSSIEGFPKAGDVVEVVAGNGDVLGYGHWSEGSITVRMFSFSPSIDLGEVWKSKVKSAFELRKNLGLTNNTQTNIYRLINAEGDGLPGIVVDIYKDTAVIQAHSQGMYSIVPSVCDVLKQLFGDKLIAIYDKSAEKMAKNVVAPNANSYLYGQPSGELCLENGNKFVIDWETGQKTGFFVDQRENRKLISEFSNGKNVLNAFCYTGGFSVYALKGGAELVHSVDSSQKALDLTDRNIEINGFDKTKHLSVKADAVEYIRQLETQFDVMILDPPAFAKHLSARHQAVQAYRRINEAAIRQVKSGGIIFTFSCSQAVDTGLFHGAITAAAIDAGRKVRVLRKLGQPMDHPVSIYHPEGEYLKGLVIQVED